MELRDLKKISEQHKDKLQKIKVCAFDVDGILTDGRVWWAGEEIGWNRSFNIRDGYGMKVLQRAGYKVGVISGGNSVGLRKRFVENLGLDFMYQGSEDKRGSFLELMNEGYAAQEILYMGDEHFDIPLLKRAGFSATVPEACVDVKSIVDYVTQIEGGRGAAREVIDLLRYACDIYPEIPDFEN